MQTVKTAFVKAGGSVSRKNTRFLQPVTITGASNVVFRGCEFAAPVFVAESVSPTFIDCVFRHVSSETAQLHVRECDDVVLRRCSFIGGGKEGHLCEITGFDDPGNNKGCFAVEERGGVLWHPIVTPEGAEPTDQRFEWHRAPHASSPGFVCSYGINLSRFRRGVTVTDCLFTWAQECGLFIWRMQDVAVHGCTAKDCMDYGIGAEWCENVKITGNTLLQHESDWRHGGIGLYFYQDSALVAGNRLDNCWIRLSSGAAPMRGVLVNGNDGANSGVILYSAPGDMSWPVWCEWLTIERNFLGPIRIMGEWASKPACMVKGLVVHQNVIEAGDQDGCGVRLTGAEATIEHNQFGEMARPVWIADQKNKTGSVFASENRKMNGSLVEPVSASGATYA